jgi:SAM-dependent methyltransferase
MIEVIEHLPNPKTVLAEAFRLLKPGGVLYITTPNFERYAALIQQADWPAVVHTGHLYYFSIETLTAMARAVGFEDIIDLTGPAIFESEVARVGGAGPTLEAIRGRCSTADAGRAINGRAEGLAAAPFKPRTGPQSLQADRRWTAPMPRLEGRLVGGNGQTEEDRKVYIVQRGKKHWVLSTDWLEQRGMRISDTVQVDSRLLAAILTGEPVG